MRNTDFPSSGCTALWSHRKVPPLHQWVMIRAFLPSPPPLCNFSCFWNELHSVVPLERGRLSLPVEARRMLGVSCERPFWKINYRNMLQRLITGESYHIAQGGFWGNGVAINQRGVISLEIVVSMKISVTSHTLHVHTPERRLVNNTSASESGRKCEEGRHTCKTVDKTHQDTNVIRSLDTGGITTIQKHRYSMSGVEMSDGWQGLPKTHNFLSRKHESSYRVGNNPTNNPPWNSNLLISVNMLDYDVQTISCIEIWRCSLVLTHGRESGIDPVTPLSSRATEHVSQTVVQPNKTIKPNLFHCHCRERGIQVLWKDSHKSHSG